MARQYLPGGVQMDEDDLLRPCEAAGLLGIGTDRLAQLRQACRPGPLGGIVSSAPDHRPAARDAAAAKTAGEFVPPARPAEPGAALFPVASAPGTHDPAAIHAAAGARLPVPPVPGSRRVSAAAVPTRGPVPPPRHASPPVPVSGAGTGGGQVPGASAIPPAGASGSARSWTIEMPAGMELLNANERPHWSRRARVTGEIRQSAAWLARAQRIPRLERAHILAVYQPPDRRRRDPANLYPSVKAAIDGICIDARVLEDDDHIHLLGPDMRIGERYPKGRLVLIITELPGGAS